MTTKKTKLPKNGENAMGTTKEKTQGAKTQKKVEALKREREEYEERLSKTMDTAFHEVQECSLRIARAIKSMEDIVKDPLLRDMSEFTKMMHFTNSLYLSAYINNLSMGRVVNTYQRLFEGKMMVMTELPTEVMAMLDAEKGKEVTDC